jgi:hypothetical protein
MPATKASAVTHRALRIHIDEERLEPASRECR